MTYSNEYDTQPNFKELAKQYASFFMALGGVCITVLTLILALEPKRAELHSVLIASLVVATAVSFIGAHLMAETAASISQPSSSIDIYSPPNPFQEIDFSSPPSPLQEIYFYWPPIPLQEMKTPPWVSGRLFLLASINIYLAVILTSFSLMLLPAAYNENALEIMVITFAVFLIVLGSAYGWMLRYFAFRIRPLELELEQEEPDKPNQILTLWQKTKVIAFSVVAGLFILFLPKSIIFLKWVQVVEFLSLIAISTYSGFSFSGVYHRKQQPEQPQTKWQGQKRISLVFYAAITFSCITIFALGFRLIFLPIC